MGRRCLILYCYQALANSSRSEPMNNPNTSHRSGVLIIVDLWLEQRRCRRLMREHQTTVNTANSGVCKRRGANGMALPKEPSKTQAVGGGLGSDRKSTRL